jgi:DNA polymerase III delta prime subunit
MQNMYLNNNSYIQTPTIKHNIPIHANIYEKLNVFNNTNKIPHLIFHGASGSGKRTIVNNFIDTIYENDKLRIKQNVMTVNCAHGKGIKFIREDLKFFAKTNIHSNNGKLFKTIILLNADHLTIDAQSALRRCIEQFSFNTRFFIILENKHKLLNPILSRFCEIYVPEYMKDGEHINLHQYSINTNYKIHYIEETDTWLDNLIKDYVNNSPTHLTTINTCHKIYEKGLTCIDLINWIQNTESLDELSKATAIVCFDNIRKEYRHEPMLIFYILDFMYLRPNKDLKSITEI